MRHPPSRTSPIESSAAARHEHGNALDPSRSPGTHATIDPLTPPDTHGITARELRAIQRARWRALLAYLKAKPPRTSRPPSPPTRIEEA
jgi:hypothetical protein